MRALVYDAFGADPQVRRVPDPEPPAGGAVIAVEATGLCRSDWHAWAGRDPAVRLPHVPGHEFAGVVSALGPGVRGWRPGDRVTVPFVCACGVCAWCRAGDQQVCEAQTQPGFSHWGSFAEYVAVYGAEVNLVRLPDGVAVQTAASLGCRFATAFRAVVAQGRVRPGHQVAVHGCGGVGLSAVMVAAAAGARVVAVDVSADALELARSLGAQVVLDAGSVDDVGAAVRELSGGGAHVSLDALGSHATCAASVAGLRRRGRHVQVGLLPAALGPTPLPMDRVVAMELELVGSHGMAAHSYGAMLALMLSGRVQPERLVTRRLGLAGAGPALVAMGRTSGPGIAVIDPRL